MLRLLAQRRAALATAAAAVAVTQTPKDKLSIYPEPDRDVLLIETPSELEKQIGKVRSSVTATYLDARAQVQGVVSRWISVEESVEKRIKSLVAPDEPLTPGILYVGVATLTGSVLARNRSLPVRLALPPTLLLLSLRHFLPKTGHNVSSYLGSLEDTYLPGVAEKHDIAKAHSAMTWARLQDASAAGRARLGESVLRAVVSLEQATGLKLQDTLGWSKGVARAVEGQAREAAAAVQQKAGEAGAVVAQRVEEAKGAVEQNVHEAERKADEPPKRLV
ncbi:apolipo protein O-domain-containing protein [Rhodofomes roseus]|uniref:MICOS complex subunit n=1 Tax=Rhodofomes roseus TaxID=34475 RepID=A0ABQ8KHR9_9APHY|nr:apolipo protein O-domain-containing protein [Rhodofomes roseus]KAH9837539.1 apolipo protein O-domain-containing protein [Rhodofomes roseus]